MEERYLFHSKLRIPIRHRVTVLRKRLLAQMAAFGADGRLLLLSGGAGTGKTELVRQYSEAFEGRTLWYTLDEADNHEEAFSAYLDALAAGGLRMYEAAGALACVVPEICRAAEAEIHAGERLLFVLDAFEHVTDEAVQRCVRQLAEHLPDGAQLLITSRRQPPNMMARLVIDGAALLIGEGELLLDAEERWALAEMVLPDWPEAERAALLEHACEMTGGWAAAESATLEYFRGHPEACGAENWPTVLRNSMLEGYFEREVLASLEAPLRRFLEETAALDSVDARMCAALCGAESQRHLLELRRLNLLTETADGLRYNGLLRLHLRMNGDVVRQQAIRRGAAERHLASHDFVPAARLAVAAEDTALVGRIVEQYGGAMLADGEETLGLCVSCLERIDFAGVAPEGLGAAAQHYFKVGDWARAETCLTRADAAFGKENKFGMYRGLYRGLLRFSQDEAKYARIINNAVFFLKENGFALPYLGSEERALFERILADGACGPQGLTVTFFGEFRATVQGADRPLSWRTRKSVELFAYLAELDGEAIGRRQLLAKLWNEEMPDNAVAMLHNMIYNIRKELAAYRLTDVIRYKDKQYSLDMEALHTDLAGMHELCAAVNAGALAALLPLRSSFLTYRGRYLEEIDNVWVTERREYYDAAFLRGCTLLAEDAREKGEFSQAVTLIKNALIVNPYSEELAGALLACYGAQCDYKRTKAEYQRFSQLLRDDLGIEAGPALAETYRRIMHQGG